MKPLNVVVAQMDPKTAEAIAASLHNYFRSVSVARSKEELCNAIPRRRADVAVVDLEMISLAELEQLHRDLPATAIVCTHRIPDEEMWTGAMTAGAADVCDNQNVGAVVNSALRSVGAKAQAQAA
jgi:DNA-binding NarL/FixJ family response regulator